jgi:hypothetical protein
MEREQLPCVILRVTTELPCVVAFHSATYHVRLTHYIPSGRHNLAGHDYSHAAEAYIGTDYQSREARRERLERALRLNEQTTAVVRKSLWQAEDDLLKQMKKASTA